MKIFLDKRSIKCIILCNKSKALTENENRCPSKERFRTAGTKSDGTVGYHSRANGESVDKAVPYDCVKVAQSGKAFALQYGWNRGMLFRAFHPIILG